MRKKALINGFKQIKEKYISYPGVFFFVQTHQIVLRSSCEALTPFGGGGHLHPWPGWEREPYHSAHHAPIAGAIWQWRNADQIAVWSHCLHVSQPPSTITSESRWAPELGSGLGGPGCFRGWHFLSMTWREGGLTELGTRPPLMPLSWAPRHSAGSWKGGGTGAASPR